MREMKILGIAFVVFVGTGCYRTVRLDLVPAHEKLQMIDCLAEEGWIPPTDKDAECRVATARILEAVEGGKGCRQDAECGYLMVPSFDYQCFHPVSVQWRAGQVAKGLQDAVENSCGHIDRVCEVRRPQASCVKGQCVMRDGVEFRVPLRTSCVR